MVSSGLNTAFITNEEINNKETVATEQHVKGKCGYELKERVGALSHIHTCIAVSPQTAVGHPQSRR
jgi:hypothetical protein